MNDEISAGAKTAMWVGGVFIALMIVLVFSPFMVISSLHVGIVLRLGAVNRIVEQGPHIKWPWPIERVVDMNIQTQKEQTAADAASKDLQTVSTVVAVNYNLDSVKVGDLYSRIGTSYGSKIIDPAIQEIVKAVTAKFTAEELITKRANVTDEIKTGLSERLASSDIIVSGVSIVNFDFSKSFNEAIELKVTAEQNALAAKNKLDQVKYEAEQRIAQARGEAEAIKIQAQAINSQGGADYVQLQAIKAWKGEVPQYMGIGAVPFINIK